MLQLCCVRILYWWPTGNAGQSTAQQVSLVPSTQVSKIYLLINVYHDPLPKYIQEFISSFIMNSWYIISKYVLCIHICIHIRVCVCVYIYNYYYICLYSTEAVLQRHLQCSTAYVEIFAEQ